MSATVFSAARRTWQGVNVLTAIGCKAVLLRIVLELMPVSVAGKPGRAVASGSHLAEQAREKCPKKSTRKCVSKTRGLFPSRVVLVL